MHQDWVGKKSAHVAMILKKLNSESDPQAKDSYHGVRSFYPRIGYKHWQTNSVQLVFLLFASASWKQLEHIPNSDRFPVNQPGKTRTHLSMPVFEHRKPPREPEPPNHTPNLRACPRQPPALRAERPACCLPGAQSTKPLCGIQIRGLRVHVRCLTWGLEGGNSQVLAATVEGQNPFRTSLKLWLKPLLVGIYRGIILLGFLRRFRILSIHSRSSRFERIE